MKARQWKLTRQLVTRPDAQRRWDQAYQSRLALDQYSGSVSAD